MHVTRNDTKEPEKCPELLSAVVRVCEVSLNAEATHDDTGVAVHVYSQPSLLSGVMKVTSER